MVMRVLTVLAMGVVLGWSQGRPYVTVDTGYCVLSLTHVGSLGLTAVDTGHGESFQYPRHSPPWLYYGALLVGSSATTIHDHFYSAPASTRMDWDWVVRDTFESISDPPHSAHQMYVCSWADTARPTPAEGYHVSAILAGRADPGYDDFVILEIGLTNTSTSTRSGVFVGLILDFDLGTGPRTNWGRVDFERRSVYMWPSSSSVDPTVGVRLLRPSVVRNLSLVDHELYVYPNSQMTELTKFDFLNGTIRLAEATRPYDYSICVSAGPFSLAPNECMRAAYAIIGGHDSIGFRVHSDSAQAWYDHDWRVRVDDGHMKSSVAGPWIKISPNPFRQNTTIRFTVGQKIRKASLRIHDVCGRVVRNSNSSASVIKWDGADDFGRKLPAGVYFCRLETSQHRITKKIIKLE